MIRKDWNFCDEIFHVVATLVIKLKIFIFIFFFILIFLFSEIFSLSFYAAVAFQQFQIYYIFKNIWKVIVVPKNSAKNRTLVTFQ